MFSKPYRVYFFHVLHKTKKKKEMEVIGEKIKKKIDPQIFLVFLLLQKKLAEDMVGMSSA